MKHSPFHPAICISSNLKGGMVFWQCQLYIVLGLFNRDIRKYRLLPYDIGGKGDCFFKPIPHQLYGTPELLYQICMAGQLGI